MDIIGKISKLELLDLVDFGAYLDGGPFGRILIPNRYMPEDAWIGDEIEVFIYFDSEDRIIATTEQPKIKVGEFACLKATSVNNNFGAFMDWGLPKDLLVPFREQRERMMEGQRYVVYCYVDSKTNRIVASSKIKKFLSEEPADYEEGVEVDIMVTNQTDLGYNCIIEGKHLGLLYKNEVFQPLHPGYTNKAFIKNVRADGKIDLILKKQGFKAVINSDSDLILAKLDENDGYLPYHDKSQPEAIYNFFGISKKAFKKACGQLYKTRTIVFEGEGIRRVAAIGEE